MKDMYTAKSGKKYKSIPKGIDVETWDAMTFVERLKAAGLLSNEKSNWLEEAKARQNKK